MVRRVTVMALTIALGLIVAASASAGVPTANGWYEGEEIYYIDRGIEEGVTERGENDLYLIGGDRVWQAQVVEFVPATRGRLKSNKKEWPSSLTALK